MAWWAWYAAREGLPATTTAYAHGDLVAFTHEDEPLTASTADQERFHFRMLVDDDVMAKLTQQLEVAKDEESDGGTPDWPKLDMSYLSVAEQAATKDFTKATIIEAPADYIDAIKGA